MNYISAYFFAYFLLASKINRIFATDNGYYRPDYQDYRQKLKGALLLNSYLSGDRDKKLLIIT